MRSLFFVSCALVCLSGKAAIAHPNHAVEVVSADSPLHYILQPEHFAALALVALPLVVYLSRLVRQRRNELATAKSAKRTQ